MYTNKLFRVFWKSTITGQLGNSDKGLSKEVADTEAARGNREHPMITHVVRPCDSTMPGKLAENPLRDEIR